MALCACGCGEEIIPRPFHKYQPARYLPNHWQRTGDQNRGKRTVSNRIPPGGTECGCGCGTHIPEFFPGGSGRVPRYSTAPDGSFYVRGHSPIASGERNGHWRGGRYVNPKGYVMVWMPEHPLAQKSGYVPEHRLVWEQSEAGYEIEHRLVWKEHKSRVLAPGSDVHHIDEVKANNSPENLVALTDTEHALLHRFWEQNTLSTEDRREAGRKGAAARWKRSDHS